MLLKMAMRFKENSLPDDIALIAIPVFRVKLNVEFPCQVMKRELSNESSMNFYSSNFAKDRYSRHQFQLSIQ